MEIEELKEILGRLADPNQKKKFEIMQNELAKVLFVEKLKVNANSIELLLLGAQDRNSQKSD